MALRKPTLSRVSASGMSNLSGLKYIVIRSTWRMYRYESLANLNFDFPARLE